MRRWVLIAALFVASCDHDKPVSIRASADGGPLAAHLPVSDQFEGCSQSCGSHSAKDRASARAQPGVTPGETTFCPVSGAVFMVRQDSPHRDVVLKGGETQRLWFCCDACAKWFSDHERETLAARGI